MKWKEKMNWNYTLIAIYVIVTAVIINCLGLVASHLPQLFRFGIGKIRWIWGMAKPIVYGFVLAYLTEPMVVFFELRYRNCRWFQKKEKSCRKYAVITVFLILLFAITGMISLLVFSITDQFRLANLDDLLFLCNTFLKNINDFLAAFREQLEHLNIASVELRNYLQSISGYMMRLFRSFADGTVASISNLSSYLTTFFFAVIICIYFLLDGKLIKRYWNRIATAIFSKKYYRMGQYFLQEADQVFSGYIRGQLLDALLMMLLIGLLLSFLGVKFSILIGIFSGIGNLIPYCGPFIAYVGTVLVCLLYGQYKKMIVALIGLFILQTVDGNIIGPRLLSKNIQIHPLLVIVSLIFGSALSGFIGMIVAVPIGALGKRLFDQWIQKRLERKNA